MKIHCNCNVANEATAYQDAKYGKGTRIGTGPYDRSSNTYSRCTVCGKEQVVTLNKPEKKRK